MGWLQKGRLQEAQAVVPGPEIIGIGRGVLKLDKPRQEKDVLFLNVRKEKEGGEEKKRNEDVLLSLAMPYHAYYAKQCSFSLPSLPSQKPPTTHLSPRHRDPTTASASDAQQPRLPQPSARSR